MKNIFAKFTILAALGVLFSGAAFVEAQIKTGGYKKISVTDAGVVAAAEYAVDAHSDKESLDITLDAILKAEHQTVAGNNYKLCLQILVANPEEEVEEQFAQAVIFKNFKNEYSLKSWIETEGCSE